jgi:spore coat protein B
MDKLTILSGMAGRTVRIDRGGPESRTGRLLAVKPDHFVLHNEENNELVYFNPYHTKSVSIDGRDNSDLTTRTTPEGYVKPEYMDVADFQSLLQNMTYRLVQINRGGPEKLEGIITDVDEERTVMISKHEIVTLFNHHIRSVSLIVKQENQEEDEDNQARSNNSKSSSSKSSSKKK